MNLEDEISDAINTRKLKKCEGQVGGGCINSGQVYEVDNEQFVYVKLCDKSNAAEMMAGEYESLKAIAATGTVRVPKAMAVVSDPKPPRVALVMEYLDMKALNKAQAKLGEQLAQLHLHNAGLDEARTYANSYIGHSVNNDANKITVEEFGFDSVTCCGSFAMVNEWTDNWASFFARNRLDVQVRLAEDNYGDREVTELWSQLQLKIPKYFRAFEEADIEIRPSLLHGDLWSGNAAEVNDDEVNGDEPVIFDACSFYGHSEYDLAISDMFGGFRRPFYEHYRSLIKKVDGFEARIELYQLFHYLNHWNHFGGQYKSQSLSLMRKLVKI